MSAVSNFNELTEDFDSDFSEVVPLIKSLSKNSMERVLIKLLAYPLKSDDINLVRTTEEPVFELAVNIQQGKLNMALESMGINTQELANTIETEI